MRFPSQVMPGRLAGSLPVAIRILFVVIVPAPGPSATSIVPAETMRATPWIRVTLFFRKSASTPRVSWRTTASFRFIMVGRSSSTVVAFTPWTARCLRAVSKCSLESSSALLGMQPTLRHVPPSTGSRSMLAVLKPSWAARIAAT